MAMVSLIGMIKSLITLSTLDGVPDIEGARDSDGDGVPDNKDGHPNDHFFD